ncbi:MAG: O-antigen ligase domain-containing protein [Cyanobacteria bacterium J06592_8]
MTPQAQLVMQAWLPVVLCLFKVFPPQRAVVISFTFSWLFLPQKVIFMFPGLPEYDRISATCYSILIATCIFDFKRFSSFKFGWLDIPMLMWCVSPFISSMTNGLGLYDGVSAILNRTMQYGVPYFLGRIYLNDLKGIRELVMGIFVGGLIYAPLCLFESVMSPQLHRMVYGYHGIREFLQSVRLGGFRPNVFMRHGLSVGMWMMAALLVAFWLWQSGALKTFWNIPMSWIVAGLYITHILVRSTGAYVYMLYGLVILFTAKWFRTALPLTILISALSFYLFLGVTGNFTGEQADQIISVATDIAGEDRAQSLAFRFDHEEGLVEKARERIIFGWGGWGRNRVFDYNWAGELVDVSVTDSLWVIAYGVNGVVGLAGVFGSIFLPAVSFTLIRYPASTWFNPKVAPAAVLVVITVLYALDCCLNNQFNPVFTLATGGLAGLCLKKPEPIRRTLKSAKHSRKLSAT